MKVLLINGSPHVKGCTATALDEVAHTLNKCGIDTKTSWIGARPISGCVACNQCRTTGQCVFNNDMVNIVAAEASECDGFVFGSPVYYASPNGTLLSFIDRLFYSAAEKLEFKPAACIVSCRRGGATASFPDFVTFFKKEKC